MSELHLRTTALAGPCNRWRPVLGSNVWRGLPAHRTQGCRMDIYDTVLKHGIQNPTGFDHDLAERGKPTRPRP